MRSRYTLFQKPSSLASRLRFEYDLSLRANDLGWSITLTNEWHKTEKTQTRERLEGDPMGAR